VGKSLISPPAWLDRNQPRGRYPKLLIPDPDGLARCLAKTYALLAGSGIRKIQPQVEAEF